jgi:antitoxin CptB
MAMRVELSRLRWRCRRGLLENDLILARFLDARGEGISAAEIAALERLLQLSDNELWDLLSGRQESAEAALAPLLHALRAVGAGANVRPADGSVSDSARSTTS